MRRLLLTALLVACFGSSAYATDARIQSLGGHEKAWTVQDETNVLFLPSTLLLFPNTVYVDIGFNPDAMGARDDTAATNMDFNGAFGFNYALGDNTVIGVFASSLSRYVSNEALSRPFYMWGDAASIWNTETNVNNDGSVDVIDHQQGDQGAIHNADHKGSILFGHRVNKLRLGAVLSFWGDKYVVEEPANVKTKRGGTFMEANFGLGYDLKNRNSVDFALGASVGWFDEEDIKGSYGNWVSGDPQIGVKGLLRAIVDIPGGEKAIPYVKAEFAKSGVSWNQEGLDLSASATVVNATFGADLQIQPLEDVYIFPGIGAEIMLLKLEDSGKTVRNSLEMALPFYGVSVDAKVASWLSLRFGARQSVYFRNLDVTDSGQDLSLDKKDRASLDKKESDVFTDVTFGAGMKFGSMQIDLMINPAFLTDGPSFLSPDDGGVAYAGGAQAASSEGLETGGESLTEGSSSGLGGLAGRVRQGFALQAGLKFTW